jgi:hypothetical protein
MLARAVRVARDSDPSGIAWGDPPEAPTAVEATAVSRQFEDTTRFRTGNFAIGNGTGWC